MRKGVKGLAVLLALLVLAFASAAVLGFGCPVQTVTGFGCPGCGLSRALVAVLRGEFAQALRLNPMIYVLPPVFLFALFGKKPLLGTKTRERVLLWGVMALWAGVWLVRLVLHDPVIWP